MLWHDTHKQTGFLCIVNRLHYKVTLSIAHYQQSIGEIKIFRNKVNAFGNILKKTKQKNISAVVAFVSHDDPPPPPSQLVPPQT